MATRGKQQHSQAMNRNRYDELRTMLEERRREIVDEMREKIRGVRAERSTTAQHVCDEAESSEADTQDDLEFALLQMKTETLLMIDQALARLEDGTYGDCYECGDEIAERRLRALPFAARCKDCEEIREATRQRERFLAERRGGPARFADLIR